LQASSNWSPLDAVVIVLLAPLSHVDVPGVAVGYDEVAEVVESAGTFAGRLEVEVSAARATVDELVPAPAVVDDVVVVPAEFVEVLEVALGRRTAPMTLLWVCDTPRALLA
jgi:hypothetical protein